MNDPSVPGTAQTRLALLLVTISAITALYWILWFTDRSLLASETTKSYYQFENAFPLADGWWVIAMLAAAWGLVRRRAWALGWLLISGGAGLYLFCMDVLYDAEHGIWTKGVGGGIEAVINVATLVINIAILRWAWRWRSLLLRA
jgi:hypothetical protein